MLLQSISIFRIFTVKIYFSHHRVYTIYSNNLHIYSDNLHNTLTQSTHTAYTIYLYSLHNIVRQSKQCTQFSLCGMDIIIFHLCVHKFVEKT